MNRYGHGAGTGAGWINIGFTGLEKRVPHSGTIFGPAPLTLFDRGDQNAGPCFCTKSLCVAFQVEAVWKWVNMLHEVTPKDRQCLRCNMDETSVKLFQDAGKGFVTAHARRRRQSGRKHCRQVSRAQLRTAFTQVTFICDNRDLQQLLPQILIVNSRVMSKPVYTRLVPELPANIKLWRRKSAWMDISTTCEVVVALAKSLQVCKNTHQVILGVDAARIHLNERVWRTAARCGILMYCIAAKITWALQPCDVYVFASYKWKLRCIAQKMAIARNSGDVSLEQTIKAVVKAVEAIINGRCWKHAFEHLGLNGSQDEVSSTLLGHIGHTHTPMIGSSMLTLAELQSCFHKGAIIPIDAVFKMVTVLLTSPGTAHPLVEEQPSVAVALSPWIGRTRLTSRTVEAPLPIVPSVPSPSAGSASGHSWRPTLRLQRLPSAPLLDVAPPLPPPL